MPQAHSILTSIFGLEGFRPRQREIVNDVLAGRDALVVMPTGAGKSLCYQLPAVALRGLTLIVSPLISLMTDQVRQLRDLRIPAMMLCSAQSSDEQRAAMARLREGFRGLLYVAPERFSAPGFVSIITQRKLSLLAIDEAHCISQWGHDFRPEYLRLGEARKLLGLPLTMALTATATPQVREDIVRNLALHDPAIHVTGFDRPNLSYQSIIFEKARNKDAELIDYLSRNQAGGIVYCSTRKEVEQVATLVEAHLRGRTIVAYHAGMAGEERSRSQRLFVEHDEAIVIATNAFGMGINKPNLRFVIHYNLPGSVEAYYQEAGRAGRDGEPAECILYFAMADVRTQRFFIDKIGEGNTDLSSERTAMLQRRAGRQLNAMMNYAQWERCRRRQILEYFGENAVPENCLCDVCGAQRPAVQLSQRAAHVERRGTHAAPLRDRMHPAPPATRSPRRDGVRARDGASPAADHVPFWDKKISPPAAQPRMELPSQVKVTAAKEVACGKIGVAHGPTVEARFERLRTWRLNMARERGWRAFRILHDATLAEIARVHPRSMRELMEIKGIGKHKAGEFGEELLAELARE